MAARTVKPVTRPTVYLSHGKNRFIPIMLRGLTAEDLFRQYALLPDPLQGGMIRFGPKDIQDQFTVPFDIPFTQGGMIAGNKLFYTFGAGDAERPDGIRVYDLSRKCLIAGADLQDTIMGAEEIESCSFRGRELICNTNAKPEGGYYSLGTAWYELLKE